MTLKTFSFATLAVVASLSAALAAPQTARIEVGGLTCPSCVAIAGQTMKRVDSVTITGAEQTQDPTVAIFTIRYDDAATTPDAVAAAVTDGVGYSARVLGE